MGPPSSARNAAWADPRLPGQSGPKPDRDRTTPPARVRNLSFHNLTGDVPMYHTKSSNFIKFTAIITGLLLAIVVGRAMVWYSGADGLPAKTTIHTAAD